MELGGKVFAIQKEIGKRESCFGKLINFEQDKGFETF